MDGGYSSGTVPDAYVGLLSAPTLHKPQVASIYETYQQGTLSDSSEATKMFDRELRGECDDLLIPLAPMAVRHLITAHGLSGSDGCICCEPLKILFHVTFIGPGWIASVVARVIRVIFSTVFAPITLAVATFRHWCYSPYMTDGNRYNLVQEDLRRIGNEWVDLAITLTIVPMIGSINFFGRRAIPVNGLAKFYGDRIDHQRAKDSALKTVYQARRHVL